LGGESSKDETHKNKIYMGGYMVQINMIKLTLTPRRENKWLILFSASMLLQLPGLNERGVSFCKSFS
jgi:hypothetical protein